MERMNREIGRPLRHLCHDRHTKWANELNLVEEWLNSVNTQKYGFYSLRIPFSLGKEGTDFREVKYTP